MLIESETHLSNGKKYAAINGKTLTQEPCEFVS
jgi:hypothetical protein